MELPIAWLRHHLTRRQREMVRGAVRVVIEEVRLFDGALFGDLTQAEQVVINSSAEYRLFSISNFNITVVVVVNLLFFLGIAFVGLVFSF